MDKQAYEYGIHLAMADAGLVPLEKTAFIAPAIGALAAPEGEGWRGAGGASLGAALGSLGGSVGGGLLGLAGGAGYKAISGDTSPDAVGIGGRIGALAGGLGGGIYGGVKGYQASVMDDEKKQALLQQYLAAQQGA
jgi:hypothetical protein